MAIDTISELFVGDGSTFSFNLTNSQANTTNSLVIINGLTQIPVVDYSIASQTLSLTLTPFKDSDIEVKYLSGIGGSGSASVTESGSPPVSPNEGDLWYDINSSILSVYYGADNTWVQVGEGPIGATGFVGSRGFTGSQGDTGFTGSQGDFGFTGSIGFTGSKGSTGNQGPIGFVGSVGPLGYTGSIGDKGYTGSRGFFGYTGSFGYSGSVGFTGSQGIPGTYAGMGFTGSQGDFGFTGSKGSIGFSGSQGPAQPGYDGSRGATGYTGSIGIGYTGSAGERGVIGYTGSFGSIGFTGSIGTGYTGSSGSGYVGSRGDTGTIGYTGSIGPTGSGYTGSRGLLGYTGSAGNTGFIGSAGSTGFTGSKGDTGISGTTGPTGFTGSAGTGGGGGTYLSPWLSGSAVSRTFTEKMSDIISVKDYGAKGDGVTDDAQAIRNAISAAALVVGLAPSEFKRVAATVYFPPGVYNVGSTITISTECISLRGAGRNATLIRSTFGSGDLFYVSRGVTQDINYVTMSDFTISSTTSRSSGAFIHLVNTHNCYFDKIEISSWGGMYDGIVIDGGPTWPASYQPYTNKFTWIQFSGPNGHAGFVIGSVGYPQDTWIDNCEINGIPYGIIYKCGGGLQVLRTECLNNNVGMLIQPLSGQECIWTWLHMFQVDTGTGNGIEISPYGGAVKVVNMSTCWAASMNGSGLTINNNNGGSIGQVTVTGGTFLSNRKNGIETFGGVNGLIVGDSTIVSNSKAGSGSYHGIYIGNGARRVNIHGNQIGKLNTDTNAQGYGVFIDSGVDKYIITNNIIDENVTGAISDNGGSSKNVSGNVT